MSDSKDNMQDTEQMVQATKYNSIEHVRARVAELHKAVHDSRYDKCSKLFACMALEAYGLEPAWGERGCPTELEYLDFLGEIHASIDDHPEMEDA